MAATAARRAAARAAARRAVAAAGTGTRRCIISPHAARRLYFAGEQLYRSDDRGDSWTPVSPDLTRNLDRDEDPDHGQGLAARLGRLQQATTTLSTITAIDESPLLEGLLYVGTDDGLVQITEDGGKNWRKVEQFPGVPEYTLRHRRVRIAARCEHACSRRSTTISAATSSRTW